MKTYFFIGTPSPKRGYNVRITVYRNLSNMPLFVGSVDRQTASWYGARGEAQRIIHDVDHIPLEENPNTGGKSLKGLLRYYGDVSTERAAIRLVEIATT